MPSAYILPVYK